jgi:hypothetical protein
MYQEFLAVLGSFIGPERMQLIVSILQKMDQLNYTSAWDEIEQVYFNEDDLTGSELLTATETILMAGLDDILGQHSLMIGGALQQKNKVLGFIIDVQNWQAPQAILDVMENYPGNNIATFCDLYEYITTESYATIEPEVMAVSDTFIDGIRRTATQSLGLEQIDEVPTDMARVRLLKSFVSANGDCPIIISAIKNQEIQMGTDHDYLICRYSKQMFSFEPSHPKVAAQVAYSMAVCSNVPIEDITAAAKRSLDQIYSDEIFNSRVVAEIDNVAMGLNHEQT